MKSVFKTARLFALACLTICPIAIQLAGDASGAGFGIDDRVPEPRQRGTFYGAIGMVYAEIGDNAFSGTGFMVSPCHMLTAHHVLAVGKPIDPKQTVTVYMGIGSQGPAYEGQGYFGAVTTARPVVWGDHGEAVGAKGETPKPEAPDQTKDSPADESEVFPEDWGDWVLLKLDDCLGDPKTGFGYLRLEPRDTRALVRSGETPAVVMAGLPYDRSVEALTVDPTCRTLGQMDRAGWQIDCYALPGNSGGPILDGAGMKGAGSDPATWPRVMGLLITREPLDGLDEEVSDTKILSADDPSYPRLLSTMIPVSAFIHKIASYLPPDPAVAEYIAGHRPDRGYDPEHPDAALADLAAAVKAKPTDAELRMRQGLWLAIDDRLDETLAAFQQALRLRPDYSAALLLRAQTLIARSDYGQDDLGKAKLDLDRLVTRYPYSLELRRERAYVLTQLRRYADAVADLDAYLAERGHSSGAFLERGNALAELGHDSTARRDYDHAVSLDPEWPYVLVQRGNFLSQIGDGKAALADFDSALKMDPELIGAMTGRAYTLLNQGDAAAALAEFDRAVAADPESGFPNEGRATVHQAMGDLKAAVADYRIALKSDAEEPFLRMMLHVAELRLGERKQAQAGFETLADDTRQEDWVRQLAGFLAGRIDEAALARRAQIGNDWERAAHAFDLNFYTGQAALAKGDTKAAKRHFQAVVDTGMRQYLEYGIAAGELQRL